MKEFAVIGLGNFGATVAKELSSLKCKITAIDSDQGRVQSVQEYAHAAVVADATSREFLEGLDVKKFDGFLVSTGENTNASILITLHLKELGAQRVIAKAKSDDHAKILIKVGASDAIIPEQQMANRLAYFLAQSNLIDYLPLSGEYGVAEVDPPAKFEGKTLRELKIRPKYNIQVIAIKDESSGEFKLVPGAEYRIGPRDILVVVGKTKDIDKLQQ